MWRYRIKALVLGFTLLLAFVSPLTLITQNKAEAVSASDWQAGNIIDDAVFFNPHTMSSQDIQNFLAAKGQNCTSNCLRDYSQNVSPVAADAYCSSISGGSKSAATIIKEVTAACLMNPQAMLVLIQKEQGLITSSSPSSRAYKFATGYCVYDTTPPPSCSGTDGFFNQIYYAARQFQRYAKNPNSFNYAAGRTSNIAYHPNGGCGSGSVTIQNAATAGLYNYTPYQPNQAALNAGYGTGDGCSSYGNRNFWRYFWDWFGNPKGSEYGWLIEHFGFSGGDNILTKDHTETITLKARNVSRHPWYRGGEHPVRLGTWNPANRGSALLPVRPATLQEDIVQPNEVGTFQFQVTPAITGSFLEPLNLVVENHSWMDWPGFSPTIHVTTNPYQWRVDRVEYGNSTGVMDVNSVQSMVVRITNTGNATWNKTNPPVWLATREPSPVATSEGGKWPSNTRITQFNESTVAPGEQASFQFNVRMPGTGNYYQQLSLVAEGYAWFNEADLVLFLHGKTFGWQPVWSSLSTGNANIGRGQTFDITVRARNTGEATWYRSDNYPVRLGTSNPIDRGSGFYYSPVWLRDTRPARLVESSVPPGSEGTFTFTARTPDTPGLRDEYFNLVSEGLVWFGDPGFKIRINVL